MGSLHKLGPKKPRKLGETQWTEGSLRLSPVRRMVDSDWFWPAIVTFQPGAFLIVLFW